MKTENLSTLKIHKLTQAQYEREREAGRLDANALYLTPDETTAIEAGTEVPANAAQMKALAIGGETFEVVDAQARASIAALGIGGCRLTVETITIGGDSGDEAIAVTGLSLDLTSYSAKTGDSFYINPVIIPSNATNRSVTWKTSNASVATVDSGGYVTCKAEGNVVITCTTVDGGFTATCAVSVAAAESGGEPEPVYYTITKNLTNATINNSASSVLAGSAYSANITAASGYEISSISVVMGGVNITNTVVSGSTITIAAVTGNVSITATATAQQTTGGKVQLSTLARTEGFVKADGSVASLANTYHVTVPYTDGMQISTVSNAGWNRATYPPIVVYDNGQYSAPEVTEVGSNNNIGGKPGAQFTATLSGYSSAAVVKVSFLIGNTVYPNYPTMEATMDYSDYYWYIPGGEN